MLGIPGENCQERIFVTAAGTFTTDQMVCINDIMLPCLSTNRTFTIKLRIIPQQYSHGMTYGAILGQDTMRDLDLDTSIRNGVISWGEHQTVMVPRGYWTDECIRSQMNQWLKHPTKLSTPNSLSNTKMSIELTDTMGEVKATEALQPTDYKKADILQIAPDCDDLSSRQQEKLLQVLTKYQSLFQGKCRESKGTPITILLMENTKQVWAKP